jgi:tetratricopeptide (TPR) repeat protein/tRNA A-37 threonylcarbamoyl transferase component Bud32
MVDRSNLDLERRQRLERVMADFLLKVDAGQAPDPAAWLARYPELNPELAEFFADQAAIGRLIAPPKPGSDDPSATATAPGSPPRARKPAATLAGPGARGSHLVEPTHPTERGSGPEGAAPAASDAEALARGTRVTYFGDYELIKVLGGGGMGVVYKARQISLNRPVALKMLRTADFASDDELRRFQNEAEAVATLDHPHIVPILEVGSHDGRRYFSMKLIGGHSLDRRLADFVADPHATARLIAQAADAVNHAHQRGILHRDLKPANILVDDQGEPHVTDFGLAKRVASDSDLTNSGAILGTPAYMAPEQASGRRGAVTTASDVYGLGATLYAMLAGRAPFGGDSVAQTLELVRERTPEPPSAHNAAVPRDLETICLKCLAKDPRRRYATAAALADDLRHYLAGEPIAARPVGTLTRAWMWSRRKPALAGLIAGLALTLLGGLIGVATQWRRAEANFREAEHQRTVAQDNLRRELTANVALREANARETAARERAQARFQLALEAVRRYYTGASEDVLLKRAEFEGLRKTLLNSALEFYKTLQDDLGDARDPSSRAALADAYQGIARITRQIGSKEDAVEAFRKQVAIREALLAADSGRAEARSELARALHDLADTLWVDLFRLAEARQPFERATELFDRLTKDRPEDQRLRGEYARSLSYTGDVQFNLGERDQGRAKMARAVTLQERLVAEYPAEAEYARDLAEGYTVIGLSHNALGTPEQALPLFRRSVIMAQRAVALMPQDFDLQFRLAVYLGNLGSVQFDLARTGEARESFQQALAILERAMHERPTVTRFQAMLGFCHVRLATLHQMAGRYAEALTSNQHAVTIYERLIADNPSSVEFQANLAEALLWRTRFLGAAGRAEESLAPARRGLAIMEALAAAGPDVEDHRVNLAYAVVILGNRCTDAGRSTEALALFRRGLALLERLCRERPQHPRCRYLLSQCLGSMGARLFKDGAKAEALTLLRRRVTVQEGLARDYPEFNRARDDLGYVLIKLATVLQTPGEKEERLNSLRRARETFASIPDPSGDVLVNLAKAEALIAGLEGSGSDLTPLDRAVDSLRRALKAGLRDSYGNPCESDLLELSTHPDYAPLRFRPGVLLLLQDAAFPEDPFAR